jgi:hypothetical protein
MLLAARDPIPHVSTLIVLCAGFKHDGLAPNRNRHQQCLAGRSCCCK